MTRAEHPQPADTPFRNAQRQQPSTELQQPPSNNSPFRPKPQASTHPDNPGTKNQTVTNQETLNFYLTGLPA